MGSSISLKFLSPLRRGFEKLPYRKTPIGAVFQAEIAVTLHQCLCLAILAPGIDRDYTHMKRKDNRTHGTYNLKPRTTFWMLPDR